MGLEFVCFDINEIVDKYNFIVVYVSLDDDKCRMNCIFVFYEGGWVK